MKDHRRGRQQHAIPAPLAATETNRVALLSEYVTPAQLARELDVSERTVHRWHALRQGPPRTKIGNKVLYRRAAVDSWLSRHESDPDRERRRSRQTA